jgi:hypothetical protein
VEWLELAGGARHCEGLLEPLGSPTQQKRGNRWLVFFHA